MRDMKQKDKGSQEKGNAADVKEEVERQLAAVKDKAEKDAIVRVPRALRALATQPDTDPAR